MVWLAYPSVASKPRPGIVDPLIRAAVLADLALGGALADAGDGLEVDTTPTGFVPADHLLQGVLADPSRPLGWWLLHAPVSLRDIAQVLIRDGYWQRRGPARRYREVNPASRKNESNRLAAAVRDGSASPAEMVTAALLTCLPRRPDWVRLDAADMTTRCGLAAWLVPDLLSALARRQALIEAAGRDARSTQSATYIV